MTKFLFMISNYANIFRVASQFFNRPIYRNVMKTNTYTYDARKLAERQTLASFGYELEEQYAKILNGWVNSRDHDCGRDIEFRDPTDPRKTVGVQVKATFYCDAIVRFIGTALRSAKQYGRTWTNFCIGEPPLGMTAEARLLILRHFEQHGAWVENDLPRRSDVLAMFERVRNEFPPHTVQRVFLIPPKIAG